MAKSTLRAQLAAIQQEYDIRVAEIHRDLETCQAERTEIHSEIQTLQERLNYLNEYCALLQEEIDDRAADRIEQELQTILAALKKSQAAILQAQEYWLALTQLRRQRQKLLDEDPTLESALKDYRSFEADPKTILESVLPSYRQALLEAHEQLRQRLAPYLKLEGEEHELQYDRIITIQLIVVEDPEDMQINWITPFPSNLDALPPDFDDVLCDVVETLMNGIVHFNKLPDWFFAELSTDDWAGYAALQALAEYTGERSLADITRESLQVQLADVAWFRNGVLEVQVAEMSKGVWDQGQELDTFEPVLSEIEPVGPPDDYRPLIEKSHGWYYDADVLSWERPLKVASDSLWNAQARRLRTLLIRMVAKGKIGEESAPSELLWQSLPEPHNYRLQEGIERMIGEGLMIEVGPESGEGHSITLNPEMLGEVQSLINRDVTRLWAGITGAEASDLGS